MMKKVVILHSDVAPDAAEDELDCLKQAESIAMLYASWVTNPCYCLLILI